MATFLPSPQQSAQFTAHLENVPPPGPVPNADLANPIAMTGHKRSAVSYYGQVKRLRRNLDNGPTVEDHDNALFHLIGTGVGAVAGSIQVANQGAILDGIAHLAAAINVLTANVDTLTANVDTLTTNFNAQRERVDALSHNGTARAPDDELHPPRVVGKHAPPGHFPNTLQDIRGLGAGALLNEVESYYDLPHTGGMNNRRQAVRRAYGVPRAMLHVENI